MLKNTMKAGKIVKQAVQMQMRLRKLKKELSQETFAAVTPDGSVSAIVTGDHKVVTIDVTSEANSNLEVLLPQVIEAVNAAISRAEAAAKQRAKELTKGSAVEAMYEDL